MRGLEGTNSRLTAEAEWKKSLITDAGLVITPMFDMRGDGLAANLSPDSVAAINSMASDLNGLAYSPEGTIYNGVVADIRSAYTRFMATAGLELRWPVLFSTTGSSHVLEPMAQLFARPDERFAGRTRHPERGRSEFRVRRNHALRARQVLGLRPHRRAAPAPISACAIPAASPMAGPPTRCSASPIIWPARTPSPPRPGQCRRLFSGLETDTSDYVGLVGFATPNGIVGFGLQPASTSRRSR